MAVTNQYYTAPTEKVPITTVRSSVRNSDAQSVQDAFDLLPDPEDLNQNQVGTDSSTVNTLYEIAVTFLPNPLTVGYKVRFLALLSSATAPQMSVNGTTNINLVDNRGIGLVAGSITADQIVEAVFDGTDYQVTNPAVITTANDFVPINDNTYDIGSVALNWKDGFFAGTVLVGGLKIDDTSADHQYIFGVNELAADRTVTLPLLGANDVFVFESFSQTLANKTLTLPKINDTSSDHTYNILVSELAANRNITLPLLGANDTFVFAAFSQTLTNKTLTSPVITTSPTAAGATWPDLGIVTTVDINGGTVDGTIIGGATPAAITGTTGNFSGAFQVAGAISRFSRADATPAGTALTTADDLVIGSTDTADTGATFFGSNLITIAFGDAADNDEGRFRFTQSPEAFDWIINGVVQAEMTTSTFTAKKNLVVDGRFSLGATIEYTIASNAITITNSNLRVDTESDASSDDLDTINGGIAGQVIVVRAASSGRTVVLKHGVDNLNLLGGADFSLTHGTDTISLISNVGISWDEISRSDNLA